jgi:predicted adenine nucleotide alpha hydrolase (AANH) superfamily ATPase
MAVCLHLCCAPCGITAIKGLKEKGYSRIVGIFYNPNIYPISEHKKRLFYVHQLAKLENIEIKSPPYTPWIWEKEIIGLEDLPEGGARCEVCFNIRLKYTYLQAKLIKIPFFTTSLTTSPHKSFSTITKIATQVAEKGGPKFLALDFKHWNKIGKALTKKYNFYRQRYCGCKYSL